VVFGVMLAGCATSSPAGAAPDAEAAPKGAERPTAQKPGPSLTFEDQQELVGSPLLVETERQREELLRAQENQARLEADLAARDAEVKRLSGVLGQVEKERAEFKKLLDESIAKERTLKEQAAAAEIEKLRMERKLIEMKLGELVKAPK
ncbi:MAG TPA: hypothetical protein VEI02_09735, partial [Planctomycetota bacterium]|nr:hypothetical protein [Planctomycetota bacterium]